MKLSRIGAIACVTASLAAGLVASAAQMSLNAVTFPEGRSIDLAFKGTSAAPSVAKLDASVEAAGTQTRIELSWRKMQPALLFGGEITSYVLWSVTKDGVAENLGEVVVSDPSGDATFQSGRKEFALMLTGEPFPGVTRPTDVVLFTNEPARADRAKTTPFSFDKFLSEARPANASIDDMEWKGGEPVWVAQAKAVYAMAERVGAAAVNPKAMTEAKTTLAQAENSTKSGGSRKSVMDYSRRTTALASEAIRDLYRKRAADEAARVEAERRQKEESLRQAALSEADRRKQTEQAMAELEKLRQSTAARPRADEAGRWPRSRRRGGPRDRQVGPPGRQGQARGGEGRASAGAGRPGRPAQRGARQGGLDQRRRPAVSSSTSPASPSTRTRRP